MCYTAMLTEHKSHREQLVKKYDISRIVKNKAAFSLALLGVLLLVVGVTVPVTFPSYFDATLTEKLIIRPDSEMEAMFRDVPVPISFQIWFLNVTNAKAIYEGAKPVLQQVGPYSYTQKIQRVDLRWNHDLGTVRFKQIRRYYFDPERSNGSESDLVTTINPVFITLASKVSEKDVPSVARAFAQLWFIRFGFQPFMTHPVGELLFHGYSEPLMGKLFQLTNDPLHARAETGFFYRKNGTEEEETEMFTGELGIEKYQNIFKWNHAEQLNYWSEDHCNMLNGTDGAQFPRPVTRNQVVRLYPPDLCRSIYAVYEKDVSYGSLTLHRFVLPRDLLSDNEYNKCFCTSNFTCRSGMIDITPCRNAPLVISTPHFYQGDELDVDNVVGLRPIKEEHQTFLDIEPNTGVAIRASKRIQLNMPLRRYAGFPSLKNVPELIFPILWINESVHAPLEKTTMLHTVLTIPPLVVKYGSWTVLAIGFLLIFIAANHSVQLLKYDPESPKRRQETRDAIIDNNCNKLLEKT